MKKVKKILAFIFAIVMVVGVLPMTGQTAQAAGDENRISLGNIVWSKDKTTYHFPSVTASFSGDKAQRLFCLSVSAGGYFKIPDDFQFRGEDRTVRGIIRKGNTLEYITLVDNGTVNAISGKEMTAITVSGTDITNEQIESFMRSLVFYRNGVEPDTVQEVSVVANERGIDGGSEIALASGGTIHYYRHVMFDDANKPVGERATWYDAYAAAKQATFKGMKGYLATITDENEELYIYGAFGGGIQAWIGGARTHTDGFQFDANSIADNALNPGGTLVGGTSAGEVARNWYWMCGPEAGTAFYQTNSGGTANWGDCGPIDGAYYDWNDDEPNNRNGYYEGNKTYEAEYALEYGYEGANWNDYSPYNVTRNSYGMSGYIIEFSPYTLLNKEGTNPTHVEEETPSAVGYKAVYVGAADVNMTVKDFIVQANDVGSLTPDTAKEKADVTVDDEDEKNIPHGDTRITVDEDELGDIKANGKGEYDLSYTYTNAEDPNITVTEAAKVTVVDEKKTGIATDGSDIEIGANHFRITLEQAKAIKDNLQAQSELIKALANAVATENGNTVDPKKITVKDSTIEPKRGKDYTVTFEYKGVPVTVNVEVLDNGSEKTTVNLTANDFTVVVRSEELTEAMFNEKSNATATASDGSNVTVKPDTTDLEELNNAIRNGQLGEYKVKVEGTTDSGASAETEVTVKVVQYPYLDAHDFIISVGDAQKATGSDVIEAADAKRVESDNDPGTSVPINVPNEEVSKLNDVTEPGVIPDITLKDTTSGGQSADNKVTATVVDETNRNKDGGAGGWADDDAATGAWVVIGANNFNLTIKQAQQIEADYTSDNALDIIRTLANAVGTNNGKAVDRDKIGGNPGNIKAENGEYPVTFTYWGQTVTVMATVKDDGAADSIGQGDTIPDINLTANDFSIPAKSPVLDTNPEETFKVMADVVAKHNDGSSVTNITPNPDQLKQLTQAVSDGKKGEYPVTVTAKDTDGKTVTATVTVTVTDTGGDSEGADITAPEEGDEHIGANNFIIGVEDVPLLTTDNVIKLSNAEAYETDTKKDVPITKVDTSKVENKPGQYPITLSTEKGTTTTVYVTIDENWKTIGDVDQASDANKEKTSVDQNKAVPADKAADKPADTKGDDKTFELSNPKDVTQNLDSGREADSVSVGGVTLPAGDYTVSGSTLTIKSSALNGKPVGTYPVVVTYKDGSKRTFNVVVVDKEVVDESNMSGDDLNNRDDLPLLLAKGIGGDKKISLSWLKYKGAEGYEVYWSYCNGKKVYKKVTSTTAKVRKATHKKLSYKKSYKYFVIAYKMVDDKKVYIAKSPQIHVAMKKDKKTNAKKVTVKKSKVTLKPGKTSVIKASMTKEDPKKKLLQHAVKFRYYTDDYRVATVSSKGKIKAVAAGKCNIYVIANNGVYKKIKVTVKK
ncbi:MAG: Ig-like domain-containing protein [Clostridium sp.]|nr:Ig-like domain-containing protein [Clostridium sp.]